MAVPDSGQIHLRGIRRELGNNNYNSTATYSNVSLTSMCTGATADINTANGADSRPNASAPHAMSEFYSYDHDKVAVSSFSANPSSVASTQICGNSPNTTYYHNGSGTNPTIGDIVYTNSAGTFAASAGYLALSTTSGIQMNEDGEVTSLYTCSAKK